MNTVDFQTACQSVVNAVRSREGIGTLGEKTLHAVLKLYVEPDTAFHEIKVGRYYADIAKGNTIIEIQTRGFDALRSKLAAFLDAGRQVTIVHPIAATKWLCWVDPETGEATKRRKSPRRGRAQDIFPELYKIKPFLTHENLSFCIVLLDLEEFRLLDGWSRDKKKGSTRYERTPLSLTEELRIAAPSDYEKLLPPGLPSPFSAKDFAKAAGVSPRCAQTAVHILHHVGALARAGKQKNAFLYDITPD
ncbi:MAG: hypothetical protein LBS36_11340 [Oscillospiraceae bacterium]|jgi:hypothetical protein|nr:hypothetical protein [Oscillospiraceae bacterium]